MSKSSAIVPSALGRVLGVAGKSVAHRGFTLIELLIVIAIIGLLSTLAAVALNSARVKSRDARRVADVKQVQKALELYFSTNSSYPAAATAVTLGTAASTLCGSGTFSTACTGTTYMGLVPSAPTPADSACGANNDYKYISTSTSGYTLTFCLGAKTGDLVAGVHTASQDGIK